MTRTQRNLDRQITTVLNLQLVDREHYELTEYSVEQWPGNHLCVTRSYKPIGGKGAAWHQCVRIGPRGASKTIYHNFY